MFYITLLSLQCYVKAKSYEKIPVIKLYYKDNNVTF